MTPIRRLTSTQQYGFVPNQKIPATKLARPSSSRPAPSRTLTTNGRLKGDGKVEEYRHPELDYVNYRRDDMSVIHAYEARQDFLQAILKGEAAVDLAEAALHIAAEDDALVSHSAVKFPVASYIQRLQRMADEIASVRLPELSSSSPEDQLKLVMAYLFEEKGFCPPRFGRSNVPSASIVDNPGVWEDARLAYLNHALVAKAGIPAILSIMLSDVLRRLLVAGAINFVAKIDSTNMAAHPRAEVLQGVSRELAVSTDKEGRLVALNTCSFETLVECLRYQKRAYWPFPWDTNRNSGFRGAAKAFLEGHESAEGEAISRAAEHRLQRGIFTSPGAGDLRRCVAASEKLVILVGDACPEERRDLAVLYCHMGKLEAAAVELKAYTGFKMQGQCNKGGAFILDLQAGITSASSPFELENEVLVDRMLALLSKVPKSDSTSERLSLESAMNQARPQDVQLLPLTW